MRTKKNSGNGDLFFAFLIGFISGAFAMFVLGGIAVIVAGWVTP